jgi:hypothetical protein
VCGEEPGNLQQSGVGPVHEESNSEQKPGNPNDVQGDEEGNLFTAIILRVGVCECEIER